jgi:hypothetical protein
VLARAVLLAFLVKVEMEATQHLAQSHLCVAAAAVITLVAVQEQVRALVGMEFLVRAVVLVELVNQRLVVTEL